MNSQAGRLLLVLTILAVVLGGVMLMRQADDERYRALIEAQR